MVAEGVTNTVMSLETFLTTLTSIVTWMMEQVVTLLGIITSNPILLFSCGVAITCTLIGVLKRIFNF